MPQAENTSIPREKDRDPNGSEVQVNVYIDGNGNSKILEKSKAEGEEIEMLKREIGELKDVIGGKEFLLQSYRQQKSELSIQQRLDLQKPQLARKHEIIIVTKNRDFMFQVSK